MIKFPIGSYVTSLGERMITQQNTQNIILDNSNSKICQGPYANRTDMSQIYIPAKKWPGRTKFV